MKHHMSQNTFSQAIKLPKPALPSTLPHLVDAWTENRLVAEYSHQLCRMQAWQYMQRAHLTPLEGTADGTK